MKNTSTIGYCSNLKAMLDSSKNKKIISQDKLMRKLLNEIKYTNPDAFINYLDKLAGL